MLRHEDPNPLDEAMACGMKGCNGLVTYRENGCYRCDICDFDLDYDEMKNADLFARHMSEQYPRLTGEDWEKIADDASDEATDE